MSLGRIAVTRNGPAAQAVPIVRGIATIQTGDLAGKGTPRFPCARV